MIGWSRQNRGLTRAVNRGLRFSLQHMVRKIMSHFVWFKQGGKLLLFFEKGYRLG